MLTVAYDEDYTIASTDYTAPTEGGTPDITARSVIITAEDELGRKQIQNIVLQFNKAPVEAGTIPDEFHIGTQDAAIMGPDDSTPPKMVAHTRTFVPVTCKRLNECVVDLTSLFTDEQMGLTFAGVPDNDAVTVTSVKNGISIKAETEYDKTVMIKITATDSGGLRSVSTSRRLSVVVNPPPKDKNESYDLRATRPNDGSGAIFADLDVLFDNPRAAGQTSDEVLTYELVKGTGNSLVTVAVSEAGAVSAIVNQAASIGAYSFTVRVREPGYPTDTSGITELTARDEVGQWIEKTLNVTVTADS